MAWNLAAPSPPFPSAPPPPQQPLLRRLGQHTPHSSSRRRAARSWGRGAPVAAALPEEVAEGTSDGGSGGFTLSSVRSQLDFLEQLASGSDYESDEDYYRPTVREQLAELVEGRVGDFSIPLGKKLKAGMKSLTISRRRNIKRQAYLNEVSRRNDSRFFAVMGAFVVLPPIVILAVAILTGYVQLFHEWLCLCILRARCIVYHGKI